MIKSVIIILIYFQNVYPRDLVYELFQKNINHSSNPCDDFYRHTCPLNIPISQTLHYFVEEVYITLQENSLPKNDIGILEELVDEFLMDSDVFDRRLSLQFEKMCFENKKKSDKLLQTIESKIRNAPCFYYYCFSTLSTYANCSKAANTLVNIMHNSQKKAMQYFLRNYKNSLNDYRKISLFLNTPTESLGGIKIRELFEDIKTLAVKKIKNTPWIINSNSVESYKNLVKKIKFEESIQKSHDILRDTIYVIDESYKNCMESFKETIFIGQYICFKVIDINSELETMDTTLNAFNSHPFVDISLPFYYISHHTKDYSSLIGLVGSVVAHEIGHSIFESPEIDNLMPYFSNNTRQCVQEQFNKTCDCFKEKSCGAFNEQMEENGADIISQRLSYDLVKDYYGNSFNDLIPGLNITHEQMFFYSYAIGHCNGSPSELIYGSNGDLEAHSPSNIRVNVLSSMPEFKKAFQCSNESRMVQSALNECIVIGERASNVKK